MWLLALTLAGPAASGTPAYRACCEASGRSSCPSELLAAGPGTTLGPHSTLTGLWRLSCDGGPRFDPEASQVVERVPEHPGTLLAPVPTAATRCWDAACALPPTLCLRLEGRRGRIVRCQDGAAPLASDWDRTSTSDTVAVVVGERVLRARLGGAVSTTAGPSRPPPPGPTRPQPVKALEVDLPPVPTGPCASPSALRTASSTQVEQGNEAAMAGDVQGAADRYRAALSIDRCNPFAWADLGEALLGSGQLILAGRALGAATRLMPRHYRAWTLLGQFEEASGRPTAAIDAYEQALRARPDHAPAIAALRRLGAR